MLSLQINHEISDNTTVKKSFSNTIFYNAFEVVFIIFFLASVGFIFIGYYDGPKLINTHHVLKATGVFILSIYLAVFISIMFGILLVITTNFFDSKVKKRI